MKLRYSIQVLFLTASLLMFSGCAALLLLGAGAAGGYLIKKGEDAKSERRGSSHSSAYSSTDNVG
jgi:hypothetical protein